MAVSRKKSKAARKVAPARISDFELQFGPALGPILVRMRQGARGGEVDLDRAAGLFAHFIATSGAVREALGSIVPAKQAPAVQHKVGQLLADASGGAGGNGKGGKLKDWLKDGKDAADIAKEGEGVIKDGKDIVGGGKKDAKGGTQEKPRTPDKPKTPVTPPRDPEDDDTRRRPKYTSREVPYPFYAVVLDRVIDHKQIPTPKWWPTNWHDSLYWVSTAIVTYTDGSKAYSHLGSNEYDFDSHQEDRSEPWEPPSGPPRVPDYGYGPPKKKIIDKDNIVAMDPKQDGIIDWLLIPDPTTLEVQISFNLYESNQSHELKELIAAIAQLATDVAGALKGKSAGGTVVDQDTQNALTKLISFLKKDAHLMSAGFTFSIGDLRAAFSGDPDLVVKSYKGADIAYLSQQGFAKAQPAGASGAADSSGWAGKLSAVCAQRKSDTDISEDAAKAIAWQKDAARREAAIDHLHSMHEIWLRIERHSPSK